MKKKIVICLIIIILNILNCISIFAAEEEKLIYYDESLKSEFENITAPNVLLGKTDTNEILYGKNIDEKIYPASLTKLLTAILVVENCELDEVAKVSENAVKSIPSGYVTANLQIGEELTIEDLLYAMLVPSANDAANVLAEYVGGNIESFSSMMNTKAKEIGCTNSNFSNPSGLHQEEHISTAKDLFLIANQAIKNETIRKIVKTVKYTLPQTDSYSGNPRIFTTTNYLIQPNLNKFYMENCIGGKTGYTEYAKNCVIEFAQQNDINLTTVVLGETAKVKGSKFIESKEMFEYIFKNYSERKIAEKGKEYKKIEIKKAKRGEEILKTLYNSNLSILVKNDLDEKIEENSEYYLIEAPINKGEIVGKINYKYGKNNYSIEIIAENDVKKSKENLIINCIVIFIVIVIIYLLKKSNNKLGKHGEKYINKNLK